MLSELVGLWEIPYRPLRLVIASASQNAAPRVLVLKLFGPLPHISHEIHHTERTRPLRMCVNRIGSAHRAAFVWHRNGIGIPRVSPRIRSSIRALRRILPFPFVWQPFPSPFRICPRILDRDPGYRLVVPP